MDDKEDEDEDVALEDGTKSVAGSSERLSSYNV